MHACMHVIVQCRLAASKSTERRRASPSAVNFVSCCSSVRLCRRLISDGLRVYCVNLDPAVREVAFPPNVDVRDSVDYRRVMEHYRLGPNGAILTSLNLFATRFADLLALLQRRSDALDVVLVDTPGQIEVFTWSASGSLISEALAGTFPTAVAYVIDSARSAAPQTLLSNMLHACSVLYRHRLPFLAVFNKIDAQDHAQCLEWIRDYDAFQVRRGALRRRCAAETCSSRSCLAFFLSSFATRRRLRLRLRRKRFCETTGTWRVCVAQPPSRFLSFTKKLKPWGCLPSLER